ncbi:TPA: arginine--tRNA ligase [Candidatus Nomurabacteria bacterium]|uniref:Arginine--tRNA ligase n=1 Tax=Candidatus Nomurabacteria bacterium GW2011_GWE1_35_16 TaxID=1618761 RepID=A0A0G0EHV2_9BACT|nr:MAG: Arginine-tRNA ligase [Candidatus Nomurabacteria bacterium GW2011_GWF1_34_20]KKP63685.1 MAG: Arginine-tRNA ligase [Candidatus Nomurabacteria bacterium GW2011_GWE2_34_25]KKP66887.1 MAG: Arginine-tRNA ligase [Candidatus Nomurabacteria bacterium GW2011_GWE1_35_16]KKP83513.1 MAG: Arginine-tRNA ligase [Candidatus Nomurabacteria bacterium GW2011_GWF2_35_66]HAE36555.1 arginine--tRNA ligase [Candidatus Nomurabacteria bacterium]
MQHKITLLIKEALKNLGIIEDVSFSIEHPADFKNGDYSTNVAMVAFRGRRQFEKAIDGDENTINVKYGVDFTNPHKLAEKIKIELEKDLPKEILKIEVAGAGFINFYLSQEFFTERVSEILNKGEEWGKNKILEGKKVMVEYTDPNPFKPFHIGHLMANAIGESISRVVEFSGANIIRANYQGDVGPHVAKAIWGIIHSGEKVEGKNALWIGECYSLGATLYESLHPKGVEAKKEIEVINKKIYDRSDEEINKIYDWGRKVTLDAFEEIYKLLGTKFEYYFFESEMAPIGEKIVRENVPKVFNESDGAIVFHGENYDKKLHTRVFINSQGLPTYEAKEIGLALTKFEKENPDLSITTTAIEQGEYMKVVQKAISLVHPDLESRMKHVTHGMMRFADGKMSSRKGNVITGESLLNDSMDIVKEKMKDSKISEEEKRQISEIVGVSALKYSILRSSLGSDIIYDSEKSISFEGDSGPYLQYTTVRANSILNKAKDLNTDDKKETPESVTDLEKYLYQFPEVVEHSYETLQPHHVATYLTELASSFNTFYGNKQILVEENKYMDYHLNLIKAFTQTMKNGLWLLGIEVPERM